MSSELVFSHPVCRKLRERQGRATKMAFSGPDFVALLRETPYDFEVAAITKAILTAVDYLADRESEQLQLTNIRFCVNFTPRLENVPHMTVKVTEPIRCDFVLSHTLNETTLMPQWRVQHNHVGACNRNLESCVRRDDAMAVTYGAELPRFAEISEKNLRSITLDS